MIPVPPIVARYALQVAVALAAVGLAAVVALQWRAAAVDRVELRAAEEIGYLNQQLDRARRDLRSASALAAQAAQDNARTLARQEAATKVAQSEARAWEEAVRRLPKPACPPGPERMAEFNRRLAQ